MSIPRSYSGNLLQTGAVSVNGSFASGAQNTARIYFRQRVRITKLRSEVTGALAGTDAGTCALQDASAAQTAQTSHAASAALNDRQEAAPSTPAFVAAGLLEKLDPELADAHASIPYASSVVVTLAFSTDEVAPLDGYGYVIPRAEGGDVLACTWSSQKWEGRAPGGSALVRVYAGRFGGRDLTDEMDGELVELASRELALLDVAAEPTLVRVHRWPLGMPQYVLGHPERVERIEGLMAEHAGIALAGAAYRGVGIPDCIASGEAAAESVAQALVGTRV